MDSVIDFIKNFRPPNLGLGLWDILVIVGLVIVGLILINWIISFLPIRTGNLIKTIVKLSFNVLSYGLIVLIVLNAILTGDYGNVFVIAVLVVSTKIDYWYKLYDNFVDKKINKER